MKKFLEIRKKAVEKEYIPLLPLFGDEHIRNTEAHLMPPERIELCAIAIWLKYKMNIKIDLDFEGIRYWTDQTLLKTVSEAMEKLLNNK